MKIPSHIWHIEGRTDGPNVLILGGVHGDEAVGVRVIEELLERFGLSESAHGKTYRDGNISGNLFLGFGNPEAIAKGTRAAGNGPDLNRSFQRNLLAAKRTPEDSPDLVRARELEPLLKTTDFLFDIHNTYLHSVPFVCMEDVDAIHQTLYRLLPVEYVLIDPDNILSQDFEMEDLGTTDFIVNRFGGSDWNRKRFGVEKGYAFAFESGSQVDFDKVSLARQAIDTLLRAVGTEKPLSVTPQQYQPTVYRLAEIVRIKERGTFEYREPRIEENWCDLKIGEVIGSYAESGRSERMPLDGKLLFQKKKRDFTPGETLCYVACLSKDGPRSFKSRTE